MDFKKRLLADSRTNKPLDYNKWCTDNCIHELVSAKMDEKTDVSGKVDKSLYGSVDPDNFTPIAPELDDLTRLHFLVRKRRVTTILEFGLGKSTIVLADALAKNKEEFGDYVKENLRRSNAFEIHSVDNSEHWVNQCKSNFPQELREFANFHLADVEMTTFNDRICTMYSKLPNVCPDLIYLDGPEQFNVKGDVRGLSTAKSDRAPMAADILLMEPFLLPGTLIITDGRTANARFLLNNLQREWDYCHLQDEDISAFELIEAPLGKINKRQIDFSNGKLS